MKDDQLRPGKAPRGKARWMRILVALALLAGFPQAGAVTIPASGEWAVVTLDPHGAVPAMDGGIDVIGIATEDAIDLDVDLYIGYPNSLLKYSISGADDPCIARGGSDDEWHVAYRDRATASLRYTRTTNAGGSWSAPVQPSGIVSSSGFVCDVAEFDTGTIVIAYRGISGGVTQTVRSPDNGATWEPAVVVTSSTYAGDNLALSRNGFLSYYQGNSGSTSTKYVAVRRTDDDGRAWPITWNLDQGTGTYGRDPRGLEVLADGTLVYLEHNTYNVNKLTTRFYDGAWGAAVTAFDAGGVTGISVTNSAMDTDGQSVWVVFSIDGPQQLVVSASDDAGITWSQSPIEIYTDWDTPAIAVTQSQLVVAVRDLDGGGLKLMTATKQGATPPSGGGGSGTNPTGGGSRVAIYNQEPVVLRNVTNLYGADVDETTGFTLITREGTGGGQETIRTWDAGTLNPLGTAVVDACGFDGVAAGEKNVGYKDCTGTDTLEIRSRSLGVSQKPNLCNSDGCPDSIVDLDEAGPLPPFHLIQSLAGFTVDYESFIPGTATADSTILGFAYSTLPDAQGADIGVFGKATINNEDDEGDNHLLQAGFTPPSTATDQLVTWVDAATGRRYVAAVQEDVGLRVWEVQFKDERGAVIGAGWNDLEITSNLKLGGPASAAGSSSVAGYGRAVYFGNSERVARLNVHDGVQVWAKGEQVRDGSLDVSGNGEVVVYANATHVKVRDNDNGELLASGVLPPGALRAVEVNYKGGTVWVFTSTHIALYQFEASVCVYDCAYVVDGDSDGDGIPDSLDTDAGTSATVARDIGGGVWGRLIERLGPTVAFVIGLAMIGGAAGLAYKWAGPAPMIVGGAATLGMGAAVALVGFPIWIPITIAAGGIGTYAAIIAKRIGGARG